MPFDTAVFYDIENLLRGYSFTARTAANLSLKSILQDARATKLLGDIAVQRAYANWSDPRLGFMRNEITSMGIDPIQVFGFNRDRKKNAADIQLAVDAIDLAYVRSSLNVFVIVSGDGGFSALAKKLHEHGKTVVGCAYKDSTNRVFASVCDVFVPIDDPEHDEDEVADKESPPSNDHVEQQSKTGTIAATTRRSTQTRVDRILQRLQPLADGAPRDAIITHIKKMLDILAADNEWRAELLDGGLDISAVQRVIQQLVPGFFPLQFGFIRFGEFLQFAAAETEVCIARQVITHPMLVLRSAVPADWSVLPDLGARELHSEANYRSILTSGAPILRLPGIADTRKIAAWLAANPARDVLLGTVVDQANSDLEGTVAPDSVKNALLSMSSAGLFEREPQGAKMSEQKFTLRPETGSETAICAMVRSAARQKIENVLQGIDEAVFDRMLPPVTSQ